MSSSDIAEQDGIRLPRLHTILTAMVLLALYLSSLWFAGTEAERRSMILEIPSEGSDYLLMEVNVVRVDLLNSAMTTRISFHLAGKLAQDEVTPAVNLKLLLNTVNGQQEFDFAKGKRINPIEAVFPVDGEVNLYPFDHHKGVMWFFVTIPDGQKDSSPPMPTVVPNNTSKSRGVLGRFSPRKPQPDNFPGALVGAPGLPVGTSAIRTRVQGDTRTIFTASVTGLTFRGSESVHSAQGLKGLTGIQVNLRRSSNVILISVASMLMMLALAVGLVAMVLKIVNGTRNMATFHIPMAVSLIFGLPALRNMQPGIPPVGTFGDSVAFTWAELAAAGGAIALVVHWLLHRMSAKTPPAGKQSKPHLPAPPA
jgi:hypothetical protein